MGRKKILVDTEALVKVTTVYKELFEIESEVEPVELSKSDKLVLSFHLSDLRNVSTESIASFLGFKNHSSICYNNKKIYNFLRRKNTVHDKEFEAKFFTFNAFFNRNRNQLC